MRAVATSETLVRNRLLVHSLHLVKLVLGDDRRESVGHPDRGVGVPRGSSPDQDGSAVNLVAQDAPHLTYGPLVTLTRRRRDAFLVQLFHDVVYLGALPAGFEDPAHRTRVLGIRLQLVASDPSVIDGDFLVAVWCFCRGGSVASRGCDTVVGAYCGPETETEFEFESLRPSSVQIALVAVQSVVAGSVMVIAPLPLGSTVMVQVWLLPWTFRLALVTGPLSSSVNAWSRRVR